jgi:importin subunit alpha-1
LGNIAGDSPESRDALLEMSCMEKLLSLNISKRSLGGMRTPTWTLNNLVRGTPIPPLKYVKLVVPEFCRLLEIGDEEVLIDVAYSLSYFSEKAEIDTLWEHPSSIVLMVETLKHTHESAAVSPVLEAIGNLVSGSLERGRKLFESGILNVIESLLSNENFQGSACWTLSKFVERIEDNIERVIDYTTILEKTTELTRSNIHKDTRTKAIAAITSLISNASSKQVQIISALENFMRNFLGVFVQNDISLEIMMNCLNYLRRILEVREVLRNDQ